MSTKTRIVFAGLLAVLAGCHESPAPIADADNAPASAAGAPAKPEPQPGAYVSPGKPGSPIGIEHEIDGQPTAGMPLSIVLTISSNAPVTEVTAQVRAGEGVYIAPNDTSFGLEDVLPDAPVQHTLTVTPLADGLYRLSIVVQGRIGGEPQAGTVSIPLRVGAAAAGQAPPAASEPTQGTGGEAVIKLPAAR